MTSAQACGISTKNADLADSFGCASRGRDDVGGGATATPPVLLGWPIHRFLGGCGGMHCCHQPLLDAKLIMHNLWAHSAL